jgi:hypothetical protein
MLVARQIGLQGGDAMDATVPAAAVQLLNGARDRASELLSALRVLPALPLETACARAAGAVHQYCSELLDELVTPVFLLTAAAGGSWVRQNYAQLAVDFAKSVRDLEADSLRRHALAQVLQNKILDSERRLRLVLDALSARPPISTADGRSLLKVSSQTGS